MDKHELIPQSCSEQLGEKDRLDLPKTLKISSFEVLHLFLGAFPPSLSAGLLSSLPQLCSQGIAVQVSVVPPWQEEEELLPAASSSALQHRENVYYLLKLCLRSESPALLPLPLILITACFSAPIDNPAWLSTLGLIQIRGWTANSRPSGTQP